MSARAQVPDIINKPAPGVSYFTPAQEPPAGTAADPQSDGTKPPKLFTPLKLRGLTLHNRIGLSPLCQYSAQDGHMTDWHLAHLGGIAQRGPGLLMIEATSVVPEGRITPHDVGLWKDSQIEPMRRVIEFIHSQNQIVGVQIAHAGRKASTAGGWPDNVKGPSDIPFTDRFPLPKAMTKQDIEELKTAWGLPSSVPSRRALTFVDPTPDRRVRWQLREPHSSDPRDRRDHPQGCSEDMPVFFWRVTATEWLEEVKPDEPSWPRRGHRQAGSDPRRQGPGRLDRHQLWWKQHSAEDQGRSWIPGSLLSRRQEGGRRQGCGQRRWQHQRRQAGQQAARGDGLDFIFIGRGFQKNPGLVWTFAEDLDTEISMANQIRWGFTSRAGPVFLKKRSQQKH
ncbi:flavin oxidoreductase/12-oxophytodienoate reductase [Paecilomyces variotii]|uniref:Flavin oxidoreductase/12-oxophytodienoate reductase n=1 Tax=Byssochlamys spectabilis TaxID=264951 RepID=A0A443HGV7_BYSSP|nr:flavin oxidoreductase/12-oxophytodienoate reductase [Paecilomyces variotii]RWQ91160.1 flavin oxidoreductase/12-oxophytodienoate reductase [Paecilomyces variotii]